MLVPLRNLYTSRVKISVSSMSTSKVDRNEYLFEMALLECIAKQRCGAKDVQENPDIHSIS